MLTNVRLSTGGVLLRQVVLSDCTPSYVSWLEDPEVNQYLETRWTEQTLESVRSFVQSQLGSENSILFAIMLEDDGRHIGNIKLGPINEHHHYADISYFIGDKSMWGKGIATKAINLVCGYGISDMNLHRIEAGTYAKAIGSQRALEKNGFIKEAVFRKQVITNNGYEDVYRYGLLMDEYKRL
ncbi:hypothetical protein NZ47_03425 [Anaerovibrio lipolyticus]|uniref:N-acetyltransferase domain-containing protein n=1 Tax=Anaerovibrio lipolyticus TaxID=82374 RepID=A0A0B2K174_9FIRM|nr:GNAT family protein [Anaerovibrio lipolyticus]KHM52663.1 hypothetical protein NZ47_03425 [Anaerovibrio lipolyticus]